MLNLSGFPFDELVKEKIQTTVSKYWRYSKIMISGGPDYDQEGMMFLDVHVTQSEPLNNVIFSEQELISGTKTIFENVIPRDYPLRISAFPVTG